MPVGVEWVWSTGGRTTPGLGLLGVLGLLEVPTVLLGVTAAPGWRAPMAVGVAHLGLARVRAEQIRGVASLQFF